MTASSASHTDPPDPGRSDSRRSDSDDDLAPARPGWLGIALLVTFGVARLAMGVFAPEYGVTSDDAAVRWTGYAANIAVGFEALVLAVVAWRPPRRLTAAGRVVVLVIATLVSGTAVMSVAVWLGATEPDQRGDSTVWSAQLFTLALAITMSITLFPLSGWRPGWPALRRGG